MILPEILKNDYEEGILHEKAFKLENKQVYCLIYFSKYLVNAIFVSKNRIDTSYHGLVQKTIEDLEEEYIDIKDSYPSIKDLLNGNLYLYLSRQYLTLPSEVSEMLEMDNEFGIFFFLLRDKLNRKIVKYLNIEEPKETAQIPNKILESKGSVYYHINTMKDYDIVIAKENEISHNEEVWVNPEKKELLVQIIDDIESNKF